MELEQDRLDMQHHLWQLTWDGELCVSPKNKGANRVLDIGTGTGIWAMDYADAHPEATVIGVDLSPIQPSYVPPNCRFEIDDIEKDWTWSIPFDFVFIRAMNSAVASWEGLLAQAYDNMEPGGYIEMQDNSFPIECDDGTMPPETPVAQWSTLLMEATEKMGRPVTVPSIFKQMLEKAGFVDVVEVKKTWPINPWPKNDPYQELGLWAQATSLQACEASALALFTRVLGWTREETLVFCATVRKDLQNTNIHGYWNM
ncbi:Trans-aconitate 2-methyltransferase 4 [Colletotrichum chlorophyti]|uniref:Trans-aconitate 2-methyltransferase 4 n=1 Tax=Colletotrichum chlorophyti TaxID=708187 RepID=A0A1Q8S624_9PEZI|nr:Trans-aconitate 2-methyltransferase 4 [Colletotrichum chlorophyti]